MKIECLLCRHSWDAPDPEIAADCPRCGYSAAFRRLDFLFAGSCRPERCHSAENDESRYWGELLMGRPHGFGIMHMYNGVRYEGFFRNGNYSGLGRTLVEPVKGDKKGEWYEGAYFMGRRQGRGEAHYKSGLCYRGDFASNTETGFGTLHCPDGAVYTGEFRSGKFNGEGTLKMANGDIYTGCFLFGRFSGDGRCTYSSGGYYSGKWRDGLWNGPGELALPTGVRLRGVFSKGEIDGTFTVHRPDGSVGYGVWKNGVFQSGTGAHPAEDA
ncbi:MAG: hypothetical protein IK130_08795 [Oscillospiraceae bacterium]|nr:hypothetical protein [Oscillospiraceae bacterium]